MTETGLIRVLHIISSLNRGGTEQYVMNCYRNIDRSKIQFDFFVLTKSQGVYEDEIKKLGGRIYKIDSFMQKPIKNYLERKAFFKKHTYPVIEVHSPSPLRYTYCRQAKKFNSSRIIFHAHNTSMRNKNLIERFAAGQINRYCTDKVACSKKAGQFVYLDQNFDVIPNAINLTKYSYNQYIRDDMRKKYKISNETFVMGYVGRFSNQKNPLFLIDIFSVVMKKVPNSCLLLVGDGELRDEIKRYAKVRGVIKNVIFTGLVAETCHFYNVMDVMVMCSFYEGLPFSGVEAQANSLPCIFSDTITTELNLSDCCEFISIENKEEIWAERVCYYAGKERVIDTTKLIESGYDIKQTTALLLDKYYLPK